MQRLKKVELEQRQKEIELREIEIGEKRKEIEDRK
jgi:hypothetical protein